jgi:DNA-binding response OmpR family regulator
VKLFLENEGYEVATACDGAEALECVELQMDIDLVILDVMMPKLDGWQTCREIRKIVNVPILMLTALDGVDNEVFGIENGADDYISKPFTHKVFMVRVKALLRRSNKNKMEKFIDEGIELEEATNSVHIKDKKASLTPKEYELLKYMILNKGIVLSRQKILDRVWGFDYFGDQRTVDTHIKSVRAKLGKEGLRITTLRDKGYCYRGEQK